VVVDAVNAVEPARAQWRALAARHGVRLAFVEVVCSDPALHRRRLEGRSRDIEGFPEPTWEDVERLRADSAAWAGPRVVLDATEPLPANVAKELDFLQA
jgi:predicted kinase